MLNLKNYRFSFVILLLIACSMVSCISTKKYIYLRDLAVADSVAVRTAQIAFETPIQKNDQLWITVGGSNPLDLVALNSAIGIPSGGGGAIQPGGNSSILGYMVEADGNIKIPYVGKVQAAGLSRIQLETTLADLFKDYTKNPVVNVRFLNYGFSVLGEVYRPGKYNMANERTNILEAIGMAGDITSLGKSDNILVVREENGQRTVGRVNILSKDLFKSPFYYLKTNDVLYVEPVAAKFINRSGIPQYLGIVAVGLSLILTILNLRK